MPHVVIVGAGANGLSMAYEMRELARAGDRITVVATESGFHSVLGPWEGGQRARIDFALKPALDKRDVAFTAAGAKRLHPQRNQLELGDGALLDYDYLVIAAGPRLAFDEVPGLGPSGFTQGVCQVDQTVLAGAAWERFVADPGPIVLGAVQGATCFGPAYQLAFTIEADLKRRGLRERAQITFITPEPHIGHLGLGGENDARTLLETALAKAGIGWIANASVVRVEPESLYIIEHNALGIPGEERCLAFKYCLLLPPSRSIEALAGIDGLVNQCGCILVDEFLRNPIYGNIYAVGVSVAPANTERALAGIPKTGYSIEAVATTAANNIRDQIDGKAPSHKPIWNEVSVADLGAAGIAFVEVPQSTPRGVNWFTRSNWVHLPRCGSCEGGSGDLEPRVNG